ncbi:TonB C-terminal domain-containing protein [Aureimonas fodinaquatilis]|uniref:TonB C-terminal domain-containing protein n=2 Tax=Aureimonas fodinaquatilis TaxID=2565783 RepID=A0A5B0E129_9HYPH|nr:TonB C-terminal domain-containing protein [Aureimonas fodinaquatilis]
METTSDAVLNVPVPTVRPRPPEPPVRQAVRERERPRKEAVKPQRQQKPPAPKPPQSRRAAPAPSVASTGQPNRQASQGAQVSPRAKATWQSRIQARVNRAASRTRASGRQAAVVTVQFSMDGGGRLTGSRLVRSSGNAALDQQALQLVQRAGPYDAPPDGAPVSLTLPIRFNNR